MIRALRLREEPKSVVSRRFCRPLRHKGFLGTIKADAGAREELGRGEVWHEPQPGGSTQDPLPHILLDLNLSERQDGRWLGTHSCVSEQFG